MTKFPAYPDDPYSPTVERFPHCDGEVLHPTGQCEYCDMPEYAVLHEYRDSHNINHTGEGNPNKSQCPAEKRRSLANINKWYGNVASKDKK